MSFHKNELSESINEFDTLLILLSVSFNENRTHQRNILKLLNLV